MKGHGPNYICKRLEEEKIPCPTYWNQTRGFRSNVTKWEAKDLINGKYVWDFSVVKTILQNPVYMGAIASQKTEYRFKLGVIADKPSSEWITIYDCRDAISPKKILRPYRAAYKAVKGQIAAESILYLLGF